MSDAARKSLRFSREAMNTDFTLFIDPSEHDADGAAQAAFSLLERIEETLSRFVTWSDICKVNALQPGESYQLGIEALDCLSIAASVAADTNRAFDPASGALIDFWKDHAAAPPANCEELPEWKTAWEEHRRGEFALDPESRLIQCVTAGSKLDLGGIGKGFALDEMARLLEDEWQISHALLSAGGSTVLALDPPEDKPGWKIGFGGETRLPYLLLSRRALSTSGTANQPTHLVDPRTGHRVTRTELIRSIASTAAEADALSTAFFVMSRDEVEEHCLARPDNVALFAVNNAQGIPATFDIPHSNGQISWQEREELPQ